jgi:hypothetical protein
LLLNQAAGTSLAGVMTSNGSAAATTVVYDFFRIDRNTTFAAAASAAASAGEFPLDAMRFPVWILAADASVAELPEPRIGSDRIRQHRPDVHLLRRP